MLFMSFHSTLIKSTRVLVSLLAVFLCSAISTSVNPISDSLSTSQAHAQKRGRKGKKKKKNFIPKNRKLSRSLDKKMLNNKYGLIGIRMHANFANIDADRKDDPFIKDPSRGAGFGFGMTLDKAFNRIFGVRGEVLYQNKNFSADGVVDYNLSQSSRLATSSYLDYLEVPLMMVVRFGHGQLLRPYVAGGVYGAALISTEGEQKDEGTLEEPRRPFTTFDYGFTGAVGTYFVLAPGAGFISAELRYSQGMANIADVDVEAENKENTNNKTPLSRQQYYMNNWALMIGYYF
jgi:hypothetical protein